MLRHNDRRTGAVLQWIACVMLSLGVPALLAAQTSTPPQIPKTPEGDKRSGEYKIEKDVDLVVLPVSVIDKKGHRVVPSKIGQHSQVVGARATL